MELKTHIDYLEHQEAPVVVSGDVSSDALQALTQKLERCYDRVAAAVKAAEEAVAFVAQALEQAETDDMIAEELGDDLNIARPGRVEQGAAALVGQPVHERPPLQEQPHGLNKPRLARESKRSLTIAVPHLEASVGRQE